MAFHFRPQGVPKKILLQRLEFYCNFLFKGNSYEDKLRNDIWPLSRTDEKRLDDFNAVYSFWVEMTKHLFKSDNLGKQKQSVTPIKASEDSNNIKEEPIRSIITDLISLGSPRLLIELPFSYSLSDYLVILQPLKGAKRISR